jgi:outer membrane protein
MRKTPLATLVTAALLSMNASALDLLQAYQDALAYDSQIASARLQRDAGREKQTQGLAGLLPQAAFTAAVSKVTGDGTSTQAPGGVFKLDYTDQKYQIQLKQPLFNVSSFIAYNQSKLSVATTDVQYEQAKMDLTLRVAQVYFDVLAAQDAIEFIQAQKAAISEQLESAKRNFEVGTATITDTHEAQARFDLAQAQEIAAVNDLEVKRNQFVMVTGKVPESLTGLRPGIKLVAPEPASMDNWVSSAEVGNTGVVAQTLTADIAKLETSRARSGHLPTLDAVAGYVDSKGAFLNSPVSTQTTSIGVQLNIPIFTGLATSSQVTQAVALAEKARADLDTARRNAAQGARTAFLGVQNGLSQVRALEAAEASSQLALEANKTGYEVGVRINIDVLNAQQQLYSTRRDLAKARYDTLLAGLKLKAVAGSLAEADLAEVNTLLDGR